MILSILFYSILFYSILFYSILFYSILFYSILLKWTALDGKQLQIVLAKLDITRVIEAVANMDEEGVSELWYVSSPYFL